MSVLTLLAFLGAAALSALILVVIIRQEESLRRDFGLEEHEEAWFTNTFAARVTAIAMTALTHATVAALLAMLSLTLWHAFAPPLGLPPLPEQAAAFTHVLDSGDATQMYLLLPSAFIETPLLHFVAIGWLGLSYFWTALRSTKGPLFDIFISYKSEDAPFARRIADALIATGWRVWFAEYLIVLNWRRWFRFMFSNAIPHSRFGLAITNDKWANSTHCAQEARLLLLVMGPQRVIELRAPSEPSPHRRFPTLARCHALESRDINTIVRLLEKITGNPFPGEPLAEAAGNAAYAAAYDGRQCSINAAGWSIVGSRDNTLTSVDWRYNGLPDGRLWGRLTIAPIDAGELEKKIRFGMDERLMFDVLAHWFRKGLKRLPPERDTGEAKPQRKRAKVRGVHLLFYDGRPQWGVTHWPGVRDVWRRIISLDAQNPVTKAAATFSFIFTFHGTFREYCRHAHIMDALALSLEWT